MILAEVVPIEKFFGEECYTEIRGWYVENDGVSFKPAKAIVRIERFDGRRQISSLPVYPKEFHENRQYEEYLKERGKRYWEFSQPSYVHYDGALLEYKKADRHALDAARRDSGIRLTSTVCYPFSPNLKQSTTAITRISKTDANAFFCR